MNRQEARERVEKLRRLIDKYRYAYHALDKPLVSDEVNDSLKHELEQLESKFPELKTADSPTQRVGGEPLDKFDKVEHQAPMLSLRDAFSQEELKQWLEKNERFLNRKIDSDFFVEAKMDGLAVSLVYHNGLLETGATRGNGLVGENVTKNLKTIEAIPLKLREKSKYFDQASQGHFEVRGEVYLPKQSFEKLNETRKKKGLSQFANPRNAAAGSIRQLDPKIVAGRKLSFVLYEITTDMGQNKHSQEHQMGSDLGFKTVDQVKLCSNLDQVEDFMINLDRKRKDLPYQIDGVVVTINDDNTYQQLGTVGKAPRGSIAYKFAPEEVTTELIDIKVQIGRTGALTPIAVLEPVQVAGTTVSRATLHNQEEIEKKGIKIGDTVVVRKAGDIIPEVVKPIRELRPSDAKEFKMPASCPVCGGPVEKKEGEVDHYCLSKNCLVRVKRQIEHFVAKKAFDIEGMGKKVVSQLVDESLINDPADIFELKQGDLEALDRFGRKSAQNLIKAIKESKQISLPRFIYSLGIRHVGEETSLLLAKRFTSLTEIIKAKKDELLVINDIGEAVAESIVDYFNSDKNRKLINRLLDNGVRIKPFKTDSKLANQTFVFSGSLENFSRQQAKSKVVELGGRVSSSVSKQTDYLVVGSSPGSKLAKAKKSKVKIIKESEFIDLIQD